MASSRYRNKELTKHLKELAMEAESVTSDGVTLTKAQVLAGLIWKRALGFKAMEKNRSGVLEEVEHPSEVWAINLVYDRLEGKVANTAPEEGNRQTAAEKVSDLSRDRINKYAGAAPKGPPKLIRNGKVIDGDS